MAEVTDTAVAFGLLTLIILATTLLAMAWKGWAGR
jgi:hypothetical protein